MRNLRRRTSSIRAHLSTCDKLTTQEPFPRKKLQLFLITFPYSSFYPASLSKRLIRPLASPRRYQNHGLGPPLDSYNSQARRLNLLLNKIPTAAPKPTWFIRQISASLVKSSLVVSVVGTSFTRRAPSKARTLQFLGRPTVGQSIGDSITSYDHEHGVILNLEEGAKTM